MARLRGLYILEEPSMPMIYGPDERRDIARYVDFIAPPQTRESISLHPELLANVDVIFSGWGAPRMDDAFLQSAPNLKAVFYGAGATGYCVTESLWKRNILVTSAYEANAIPVAEYTLSVILFSLKHGWSLARRTRQTRTFLDRNGAPGCYGSSVGLLSLGVTARALVKLLKAFDLRLFATDPYVTRGEAHELGIELVSLGDLFRKCDVVSVHTPVLAETIGMITGAHIASMKQGAVFINTARGEIVREDEMIQVLSGRTDLQAILDVAVKEPPEEDSPLYTLPNVILTPHIAGSVGQECRRMGRFMVDELRRYLAGLPLQGLVTRQLAERSSHRPVKVTVHAKQSMRPPIVAR
ncbi:MAG TPA: hydroxyacid dehydrogenase [Tepidisphaeraceae bacterium]|jgi:phosphoglycerate dehydrogenase-like enzyme|nr:hydroxyacid dehydrogenase [Tepidisphaeraceae bacterium]